MIPVENRPHTIVGSAGCHRVNNEQSAQAEECGAAHKAIHPAMHKPRLIRSAEDSGKSLPARARGPWWRRTAPSVRGSIFTIAILLIVVIIPLTTVFGRLTVAITELRDVEQQDYFSIVYQARAWWREALH